MGLVGVRKTVITRPTPVEVEVVGRGAVVEVPGHAQCEWGQLVEVLGATAVPTKTSDDR